jgi:hypothetical protein
MNGYVYVLFIRIKDKRKQTTHRSSWIKICVACFRRFRAASCRGVTLWCIVGMVD